MGHMIHHVTALCTAAMVERPGSQPERLTATQDGPDVSKNTTNTQAEHLCVVGVQVRRQEAAMSVPKALSPVIKAWSRSGTCGDVAV